MNATMKKVVAGVALIALVVVFVGKQIVKKMKMEVAAYERDHVIKQA